MLMGTRDKAWNDTVATTWLRTVDYDANEDGQWNYLEIEKNKSGKMPWLDQVITCAADTGFVALGSNGKWYKSQDAGLTWKQDKMVVLPAKFATEGRFAFCRDKQHYLLDYQKRIRMERTFQYRWLEQGRLIILLAFLTLGCMAVRAQDDPQYRMEIGAGVGVMTYEGDFNGNVLGDMQPAGFLVGRYNFDPYKDLKTERGLWKNKRFFGKCGYFLS